MTTQFIFGFLNNSQTDVDNVQFPQLSPHPIPQCTVSHAATASQQKLVLSDLEKDLWRDISIGTIFRRPLSPPSFQTSV